MKRLSLYTLALSVLLATGCAMTDEKTDTDMTPGTMTDEAGEMMMEEDGTGMMMEDGMDEMKDTDGMDR